MPLTSNNLDPQVSEVTRNWTAVVRFLAWAEIYLFTTASGAHPTSYPVERGLSEGEADNEFPPSCEV
jgi:hypothetical protein